MSIVVRFLFSVLTNFGSAKKARMGRSWFGQPTLLGSLMISSLLPGFILSSGTLSCIYPRQIDGSSSRMLLSCSQQVSYKGSNRASSFSKFKDNIG